MCAWEADPRFSPQFCATYLRQSNDPQAFILVGAWNLSLERTRQKISSLGWSESLRAGCWGTLPSSPACLPASWPLGLSPSPLPDERLEWPLYGHLTSLWENSLIHWHQGLPRKQNPHITFQQVPHSGSLLPLPPTGALCTHKHTGLGQLMLKHEHMSKKYTRYLPK